jgi:FkbM family methyltransferase
MDWTTLPVPRGLDPLYFNRQKSIVGALRHLKKTDAYRIVDVGANIGDSVQDFLTWFPESCIIAFEPLPKAFEALTTRKKKFWYNRDVRLRNFALSDEVGLKTLHASKSDSSTTSFAKLNKKADTISAHRGLIVDNPSPWELGNSDSYEIQVPLTTLDSHFNDTAFSDYTWFRAQPEISVHAELTPTPVQGSIGIDILKIDTQSWDFKVLTGGGNTLTETSIVLLEWIFDDIYGSPNPIGTVDSYMDSLGFRLWDISHVYKDLSSLRTLWVDLIYIKK